MASFKLPWTEADVLDSLVGYNPFWVENVELFKRYILGEDVRVFDGRSPLGRMFHWDSHPKGFDHWNIKAKHLTLFTDLPLLDQIWIHQIASEAHRHV